MAQDAGTEQLAAGTDAGPAWRARGEGAGPGVRAGLVGAGLLIVLAVLPVLLGAYRTLLLTEILIWGLFATSFNLLFGYTGLLSFGHAAYFAAGSYGSAFALVAAGLPLWAAVVVGALAGTALAALFGFFCVRVNEIYFALLTLAFGMLFFTLVFQARGITGGDDGYPIHQLGSLPILGVPLGRPHVFYWLTLLFVAVGVAGFWRVVRSPFGKTLLAIRGNAERVRFFGIPVRRYQYIAFVLAGAGAGLAGALLAPFLRVAGPDLAHWTTSAEVVLGSLLGGTAFFLGPAVGVGVLIWLESVVTGRTIYWPLVMGIVLLVLVLFLPGGIAGQASRLWGRVRRR